MGSVWQGQGPVGGAGPVAFARFPLTVRDRPPNVVEPAGVVAGPRPFAAGFAVEPVRVRHKKTPTHGVETKETSNILDGTDEPDTVDEPYEDEEE